MGHPLFPNEPKKGIVYEGIERIRVGRWFEGACAYSRRVFSAEELRSDDDIFVLFGGGNYELIGMNADEDEIIGRRKLTLRGKRLPLNAEDDEETNPNDERKPSKNNGEPSLFQILTTMQQSAQQQQKEMIGFFTMLIQSSKQESQLLLEAAKADARAFAEMMAKASDHQVHVMSEFFQKSIELTKGSTDAGSSSGFAPEQFLELGMTLAEAKSNSMTDTVTKLADTFRFAVEAKRDAQRGAAAPRPNETSSPASNGQGPVA